MEGAAEKGGFTLEEGIPALIASYCDNGRDAVNILQTAGSSALLEERTHIDKSDVEWVLEFGQYVPREAGMPCKREPSIGCVYGIGVTGGGQGHLMEMEVRLEAMHPGREGSPDYYGIGGGRGTGARATKTSQNQHRQGVCPQCADLAEGQICH